MTHMQSQTNSAVDVAKSLLLAPGGIDEKPLVKYIFII